jgi:hypothetical protein
MAYRDTVYVKPFSLFFMTNVVSEPTSPRAIALISPRQVRIVRVHARMRARIDMHLSLARALSLSLSVFLCASVCTDVACLLSGCVCHIRLTHVR